MTHHDEIQIASSDYWFKIVEMLQQNWALVDPVPGGAHVWFLGDASGVFDELSFRSIDEAHRALRANGFARLREDPSAQQFIHAPPPPFRRQPHPNGLIYSSGRFWSNPPTAARVPTGSPPSEVSPHETHSGPTWLQDYIEDAIHRNLCTTIYCTACGAREFRTGLLQAFARFSGKPNLLLLDRDSATAIGRALARVRQSPAHPNIEDPVRMILFEVWGALGESTAEASVAPQLVGTWSGEVLARMQSHHRGRLEEQRAQADHENPEVVRQRREAKKLARQQEHAQRLERKKDRDREWRDAQRKGREASPPTVDGS